MYMRLDGSFLIDDLSALIHPNQDTRGSMRWSVCLHWSKSRYNRGTAWGQTETNPSPRAWVSPRASKRSARSSLASYLRETNNRGGPRSDEWGNSMRALWPLLPQATSWGRRRTVLDASSPSCCLIYEWCSSIQRYLYYKYPSPSLSLCLHRPNAKPVFL